MKLRICFEKTESGRYLSHLDLARTMERSLRRAKAPLAFSEGFHPHIKMAFASALAVGTTGRREYLDLDLASRVNIQSFQQTLAEALPPALLLVAAEEISENGKSLSAIINLAVYQIVALVPEDDSTRVYEGVAQILASSELWRKPKEKPGKKAVPAKEVRGLVRRLCVLSDQEASAATFTEASAAASVDEPAAASADEPAAASTDEPAASAIHALPGVGAAKDLPAWFSQEKRRLMTLEAELLLKADGQLRPQDLWEMVCGAGGLSACAPISVHRHALLILQDGKAFSPMEGVS